ncbi:hypothetical protein LAZ67_7001267 [Cordylochernes scorpioides]|uniref:Ribosomal protein S10 n=1 Tax=Cordylochernes scorpioides TaxID=51811 RepID=A0ABY6KNM8_9ARAC|nr:hypothetical protein LAZ67_7001267 [Cordylochernes scorpioides]
MRSVLDVQFCTGTLKRRHYPTFLLSEKHPQLDFLSLRDLKLQLIHIVRRTEFLGIPSYLDRPVGTPGNETVTRRSRRLQGLQPELSTVLAFPARKKMEREENRPFCHRWRDPTVFSGEPGED